MKLTVSTVLMSFCFPSRPALEWSPLARTLRLRCCAHGRLVLVCRKAWGKFDCHRVLRKYLYSSHLLAGSTFGDSLPRRNMTQTGLYEG